MKQCAVLLDGVIIADKVKIADTFFSRLKGLLNKKKINNMEALLICPCKQIHTFGMMFSIDAVFLSEEKEVLHVIHSMAPGKASPYIKEACMVLELHEGTLSHRNIKKHDILTISDPVKTVVSK
ncbi:MAG: DUF192 domain-containing protein [Christensenellales bacterium]|jgi:uncharacterized membrane protein (UPF0127 family)